MPIVSFVNDAVSEIEAFRDVENVTFRGADVFLKPGRRVLAFMEAENGGALENVGTVLFQNIGISTGRLDQQVEEDHSVTAFSKDAWDELLDSFKTISFA